MSRRRRGLTPAEQELWANVARTTTPLHLSAPVEPLVEPVGDQPPAKPIPNFRKAITIPPPSRPAAESPLRMDYKTHKRMAKGRIQPEARLDLHGMTLATAHPELMRFILSCRENGLRMVLVITGKGRGDHGPLPTRHGALRHIVPHWLSTPPCVTAVQQVTQAHFRHGGEGAYYVYLRRLPSQLP